MFQNHRYLTKGIASIVGIDLQILLWKLIDDRVSQTINLDYLQVFDLSMETDNGTIQKVVHSQEVPLYSKTHLFHVQKPVTEKVFIIDNETYCTMLLSSEY